MTYEEAIEQILPGLYQHFKGNHYEVLSIARHSETTEPMVVYKALYGTSGIWVRPADMWNETVERDGERVPRFRRLTTEERITFYEQIYDELTGAAEDGVAESPEELRAKAAILNEYYSSDQWMADYDLDEKGMIPKELKRGVLSQDGVYDLLMKLLKD